MISIIIVAKNEEKTIGCVVEACKRSLRGYEKEIIASLAKDNSDATTGICMTMGIGVVVEKSRCKGDQMAAGLAHAKGNIIIFTDGDIANLRPAQIDAIAAPVIKNRYDFVKGSYTNTGRVTEFVIRPLLKFAFPEISGIGQPLAGQIAGKKRFFDMIRFERSWGVDIALLIDMAMAGARIGDIALPYKDDIPKPHLQASFVREIAGTLLSRAARHKRMKHLKGLELPLLLAQFQEGLEDSKLFKKR
ncbi:MAG: glycosyltransferase [archaeon]